MTYCKIAKASLLHCHKWWNGISIPSASHFSHCAYKGRDIFTVQHGSYCCDSLYVYWISWSLLEITTTIKAHRVIARNTIHHKEGNLEVVMNLIYDHLPQFIFGTNHKHKNKNRYSRLYNSLHSLIGISFIHQFLMFLIVPVDHPIYKIWCICMVLE